MNGALGWVRGFMWPQGGDPNSVDPTLRAPICVFVEFDDVTLGRGADGEQRTFFPGDPAKARWIPVYRQTASSSAEAGVDRLQFPLMLAWVLTHWKAQGMTLPRVRISLAERTASSPGVGYVAVTRVKHVRHLIFETDLPSWEKFQEARHTEAFRSRLRFDLRAAAKFSRTLRRWGFCAEDPWTREEADAASELLNLLRARAQMQRAAVSRQMSRPTDGDAFIWEQAQLDFDGFLATAVGEAVGGDVARKRRFERVAERLRSELHMPAVREALGCLIPEYLHPRLDGTKPRGARGGGDRVGVYLEADRWRVDVAEEAMLGGSHPMAQGVLEFFMKVARRLAQVLQLPFTCGTTALGKRLGMCESVEHLCATVEGWQSWSLAERARVRASREFVVPVLWDPEGRGARDWLLARVTPGEGAVDFFGAVTPRVQVFDRARRSSAAESIARKLSALLGGVAARGAGDSIVEHGDFPAIAGVHEAAVCVFGLICERLAAAARLAGRALPVSDGAHRSIDSGSASFAGDVRLALVRAFAKLREEADASMNRDVYVYLASVPTCCALLDLLMTRDPSAGAAAADAERDAADRSGAVPAAKVRVFEPLTALTWNISECDEYQRISAQAPADRGVWSSADNFLAVQLEILRYCPSVVSLQECPSLEPSPSLGAAYHFIGAEAAHAGFVHLYVAQVQGVPARVELRGQPAVACHLDVGDVALIFVALHLPPHEECAAQRATNLRQLLRALQEAPSPGEPQRACALVLAGDFNIREAEAEQC